MFILQTEYEQDYKELVLIRELHGTGDGRFNGDGFHGVIAVTGTKFTVIPWGWVHSSR